MNGEFWLGMTPSAANFPGTLVKVMEPSRPCLPEALWQGQVHVNNLQCTYLLGNMTANSDLTLRYGLAFTPNAHASKPVPLALRLASSKANSGTVSVGFSQAAFLSDLKDRNCSPVLFHYCGNRSYRYRSNFCLPHIFSNQNKQPPARQVAFFSTKLEGWEWEQDS